MRIITRTQYVCENCNEHYTKSVRIRQCQICGRDFCDNCQDEYDDICYKCLTGYLPFIN